MSTEAALRTAIRMKAKEDEAQEAFLAAKRGTRSALDDLANELERDDEYPPTPWLIDGLVVTPEWKDYEVGKILAGIVIRTPTNFGTAEVLEG